MKIFTHPVVVVDVETTGFSSDDDVIEIGAVCLDEYGRTRSEFGTLIRNKRRIGYRQRLALDVNNISEQKLALAHPMEVIRPKFIEWWQQLPHQEHIKALAFNASFDRRMLTESAGIHLPWGKCLMEMTKEVMAHNGYMLLKENGKKKPKPSLQDACHYFGLEYPENAHRALEDARITSELAIKLAQAFHPTVPIA